MATRQHPLGGRLALLPLSDLDADQKKLHAQMAATLLAWAKQSGFQAETGEGMVVGPFNPMLRSPAISEAMLKLIGAEQEHTELKKSVREVVILTVGGVWKSAYELYAHAAVGGKAGLSPQTIQTLAAGQTPDSLSAQERTAHLFTRQLVSNYQIDDKLYREAVGAFGEKGVVDMIVLAGNYVTTCALLNTFTVPAPSGR